MGLLTAIGVPDKQKKGTSVRPCPALGPPLEDRMGQIVIARDRLWGFLGKSALSYSGLIPDYVQVHGAPLLCLLL